MKKEDIRTKLYNELIEKIKKEEIDGPILTIAHPNNGETIKINGIVLYKILRSSNQWREKGIAIYKNITDFAIEEIQATRSKDKKRWIGCALTEENCSQIFEILSSVIEKTKLTKPKKRIKKGK